MPDTNDMPSPSRDSVANTFVVALGVALVCSILVASTAVLLRPQQEQNERVFRQRTVLEVAGLYEPGADIEALFDAIDVRLVDLASGDYVDAPDPRGFDPVAAASDPSMSVAIPADDDIAGIDRRAIYAPVFLLRDGDRLRQVILPVYGAGLWSTMYAYLALEPDGRTVSALRFYEHAETPGLGDQMDRSDWRAQWPGKQIFDAAGDVRIEVVRGQVQPGPKAVHQVDGLSGATLTSRGITNLLRYWTGPNGFGPFLEKLDDEADADD